MGVGAFEVVVYEMNINGNTTQENFVNNDNNILFWCYYPLSTHTNNSGKGRRSLTTKITGGRYSVT